MKVGLPKLRELKSKLKLERLHFESSRILFGLDIGTHSVKVAVLRETGKGTKLVNLGIEEIPQIKEEEREPAAIEAIKKILEKNDIKARRAITALSGGAVNINNLTVPEMPEEELGEGIRWEAEQYIPFSLDEAFLDFIVLGEVTEAGARKLEVVVIAALKETVNKRVSLLEEAGLRPRNLNINPLALWNSLERSSEMGKEEVVALVDLGRETTSINVFREGKLRFTRDIAVGGEKATAAVQKGLNLDFVEAEKRKREEGIEESSPIYPLITPVIEQLSSEIGRSLDFYKAQSREPKIDRVVLSGGGAKLKNIDKFLAEGLGIKVELSTPFRNIECDPQTFPPDYLEEVSPAFTIAIGLALSALKPKRISLLPVELRKEPKELLMESLPKVGAGLLPFILFSVFSVQMIRIGSLSRQDRHLKRDIDELRGRAGYVEELEKEKEILTKKRDLIGNLSERQSFWPGLLKGLSEEIPERVRLTKISLTEGGLRISGEALSSPLVFEFITHLQKLPYFEKVRLDYTETDEKSVKFELLCSFPPGGRAGKVSSGEKK